MKYFTFFLLGVGLCFSQTKSQRMAISKESNVTKLKSLQATFLNKAQKDKQEAFKIAKQKGWQKTMINSKGKYSELQRVAKDGTPIYYTTYNTDAAKSTRTNYLHKNGGLGLDLEGQNMTAFIWDEGRGLTDHQEYDGTGGSNRYSVGDGTTKISNHGAHVTGTIIASGYQANAKGMAPKARAIGFDWNNDLSEASNQASRGMLLSNHSYGAVSEVLSDWFFGAYSYQAQAWDEIMYNSPYYLMIDAAGNDGNSNYNGAPLEGNSKYDKLTTHALAKNGLIIANAQDATINSNGEITQVTINSSSSQGPTDDYRIKPDITGNGTSVYSTTADGNQSYNSYTGTSMASPGVTGSLLLIQQHAHNLNNKYLKAATLKGIALHTATDAGTQGPDAIFGWGVLNAKKIAETLSKDNDTSIIKELTLSPNQTYELTVTSDNINQLIASISWTDPAGNAVESKLNNNTPVLVNDLDIRVLKNGNTYYPYKLTSVTTNAKGDNKVDPYERVDINNASGTYTIRVSHKGSLTNNSQNFSLIVTGIIASGSNPSPSYCDSKSNRFTDEYIGKVELNTISKTSTGSSYSDFTSITTDLNKNNQYTIKVTPVFPKGTAYKESTTVWIDYNQDQDFDDAGEKVWVNSPSTNTPVSGSFTIPSSAKNGETRMRVTMKFDGTSTPCETFDDGEVEDYTVIIGDSSNPSPSYCDSKSNRFTDEYIGKVELNTISKTSTGSSYSDFTSITTDLNKNNQYTIKVTPVFPKGTAYKESTTVWIDYNQDQDFDDAGEKVWVNSPSTNTPVSGSFTIPSSAKNGETRMRVTMKFDGTSTPCETFDDGEVEDYTVIIADGQTSLNCSDYPYYNSNTNYNTGDYVVYDGTLFKLDNTGNWELIQNCSSTSSNTTSSLEELNNKKSFHIVQRSKNELILSIKGITYSKNTVLHIVDMNGRKVFSKKSEIKNGNQKINFHNMKSGIYTILINGLGSQKILIK